MLQIEVEQEQPLEEILNTLFNEIRNLYQIHILTIILIMNMKIIQRVLSIIDH